MERRTIIPPNMKSRNGPPISRDHHRERDYHQSSHYSYNNSMNNHYHNSHQTHNLVESSHPPTQHNYHPNSELINYVSNAWKEKVSSDKTEYFKSTESPEKKYREFDLASWMNNAKSKTRNSS